MTRPRWLVWWLLLAACGSSSRQALYARLDERAEGLCWWRQATWPEGTLLARDTGVPFARARAVWDGEAYRGPLVLGVLRSTGQNVVFQGQWQGDGLTLNADVDATAEPVFSTFAPARLAPLGMFIKGSRVRLLDARPGTTLVAPSEQALRTIHSREPLALQLPCDGLSLVARRPVGADERLRRAGFSGEAEAVELPPDRRLPAAAEPGGPVEGELFSRDAALPGFVVARTGAQARLVLPLPDGPVWVGWVEAGPLRPATAPPPPLPLADAPAREGLGWRACAEALPVSVRLEGVSWVVGSLAAGTPFSLLARLEDAVEVRVAAPWLELQPELRLLLPGSAASCPRADPPGAW